MKSPMNTRIWLLFITLAVLFALPSFALAKPFLGPSLPVRVFDMPLSQDAPMKIILSPEFLMMFAAALISVAFDWFPGLRTWFDPLTDGQKRALTSGLVVVSAFLIYGLGCAGLLSGAPACSKDGLLELFPVIVTAIAIVQGVHLGTKPSARQKVKLMK